MRILAIETSCAGGELAAGDDNGIRATRTMSAARKHARDLAPALSEVCIEAGWKLRDVELVIVNIGPGSYTGLRVGLMSAKTICYAANSAMIAVDAMSVLFESAPGDATVIHAIIDGQQGRVYTAKASSSDRESGFHDMPAVEVVQAADWAATLKPGDFVTGPALERFASLVPAECRLAESGARSPSATALWSIGLRRFQAGVRTDYWTAEPLYLRPSSAQIKWDARGMVLPGA